MKIENWLGEDNQIGIDIWNKKYCYEDETFDGWLDRVSAGNDDIRQMMLEKKFLFGGRILANRGLNCKGIKVTLSNCYVVEPPETTSSRSSSAPRSLRGPPVTEAEWE